MSRQNNDTAALPITQSPPLSAQASCLLGVLAFSFTLPLTRIGGRELSAAVLGFGRASVAAVAAALVLWALGERLPARRHWPALGCVAAGGVLGFPWLTSLALRHVPAHHAVLVVALTPLATALFVRLRGEERTPARFWWSAAIGSVSVLAFLALERGLRFQTEDLLLLLAVVVVAVGYAEGGRAAGQLGGVQVICWALVAAGPFALLLFIDDILRNGIPHVSWRAGLSFAYVSLISQVLGFCFWYRGLSGCGVARGSQVQLLQPLLSLVWCAWLLGESLSRWSLIAAALVLGCVVSAQRSARRAVPPQGMVRAQRLARGA